jgi:hypothetical protein
MSFLRCVSTGLIYSCLICGQLRSAEPSVHSNRKAVQVPDQFPLQRSRYILPPDLEDLMLKPDGLQLLKDKLYKETRFELELPSGNLDSEQLKLFVVALITYYRDPTLLRPLIPVKLSLKDSLAASSFHLTANPPHALDAQFSTKLLSEDPEAWFRMLELLNKAAKEEVLEDKKIGVQTHYAMIKPEYFQTFLKAHYGMEIENPESWTRNELKQLQLSLRFVPSFYFSDRHPLTGREYKAPDSGSGEKLELPRIPIKKIRKALAFGDGTSHYDPRTQTFTILEEELREGKLGDAVLKNKDAKSTAVSGIQHDEKNWYHLGEVLYNSLPKKYRDGYSNNEWRTSGLDIIAKENAKLAHAEVIGPKEDFATYFTYYINRRDLFDKLLPENSDDPLIRAKRNFFVHYVFHSHDISREALDQFKTSVAENPRDVEAPAWKGGSLHIRVDDSDPIHSILNFKIDRVFDTSQSEEQPKLKRVELTLVPLFNMASTWEKKIIMDAGHGLQDAEKGEYVSRTFEEQKEGLRGEWGDPIVLSKSELASGLYGIKSVRLVDHNNNSRLYKIYYEGVKPEDFAKGPVYGWTPERNNRSQMILLTGENTRRQLREKLNKRWDMEFDWAKVKIEKVGEDPRGDIYSVVVPHDLSQQEKYGFTLELRGKKSQALMKLAVDTLQGGANPAKSVGPGLSEYKILLRKDSFPEDEYVPQRALLFGDGTGLKIADANEAAQQKPLKFAGQMKTQEVDFDLSRGSLSVRSDAQAASSLHSDKVLSLKVPLGEEAQRLASEGYRIVGKAILINKNTGEMVESYIDYDRDYVSSDKSELEIDVKLPSNYRGGLYYAKEFRYNVLPPRLPKEEQQKLNAQGIRQGSHSSDNLKVPLSQHNLMIDITKLTKEEEEPKLRMPPPEVLP